MLKVPRDPSIDSLLTRSVIQFKRQRLWCYLGSELAGIALTICMVLDVLWLCFRNHVVLGIERGMHNMHSNLCTISPVPRLPLNKKIKSNLSLYIELGN